MRREGSKKRDRRDAQVGRMNMRRQMKSFIHCILLYFSSGTSTSMLACGSVFLPSKSSLTSSLRLRSSALRARSIFLLCASPEGDETQEPYIHKSSRQFISLDNAIWRGWLIVWWWKVRVNHWYIGRCWVPWDDQLYGRRCMVWWFVWHRTSFFPINIHFTPSWSYNKTHAHICPEGHFVHWWSSPFFLPPREREWAKKK